MVTEPSQGNVQVSCWSYKTDHNTKYSLFTPCTFRLNILIFSRILCGYTSTVAILIFMHFVASVLIVLSVWKISNTSRMWVEPSSFFRGEICLRWSDHEPGTVVVTPQVDKMWLFGIFKELNQKNTTILLQHWLQ